MRLITARFGMKVGSTVLALGGSSPAKAFHVRSISSMEACRAWGGGGRGGGEGRARTRWVADRLPVLSRGCAAGAARMGMTSTDREARTVATARGEEHSEIYCNRELNMKQARIKAVGFDMDYTLAQYFTAFDQLAFDGAKDKLVEDLGYPQEVHDFVYDPMHFSRGLVIDLERGNIIKMDRHKYIRVAFHGFKKLASDQRKRIYLDGDKQLQTFTGRRYVSMDTLFSLVDAVLYAHLVELKDSGHDFLQGKSYEGLFRDVRKCVDLCHRDGVIKDRVEEDPARYIVPDPDMVPMLKRFRQEGVQVFLLTNSLWDYTHVVMNFLCGKSKKEDRTTEWLDLFDIAITGACKPSFLVEPYLSLFRVDEASGSLSNTDGAMGPPSEFLAEGKVFQGGNWLHLHDLLSLSSGDQLVVRTSSRRQRRLSSASCNNFRPICRSFCAGAVAPPAALDARPSNSMVLDGELNLPPRPKDWLTLGWRTCLIVPELESEMNANRENRDLRVEVNTLRILQYDMDVELDRVRLQAIEEGPDSPAATELSKLEEDQRHLKSLLREDSLQLHSKFHPDWGQLFKSGYQDSRFATQVATYACIYTSKASNLARVSTQRSFRPVRDVSAHDLILEAADAPNGEMEALKQRILHAGTLPSEEGTP
ncbi:unnamed protein product [Pylaiella littoralis]